VKLLPEDWVLREALLTDEDVEDMMCFDDMKSGY
jgi:hypothetical protein